MSESTEAKTIRNFTNHLTNPYFITQLSIFYNNSFDSKNAINDKPTVTNIVRRSFPNQCFLYRLCLTNTEASNLNDLTKSYSPDYPIEMAYHTLFTNQKIDIEKLVKRLKKKLGKDIRVKQQMIGDWKKTKYIAAVRKGKPHNLQEHFLTDKPVRRFTLIGKNMLNPTTN